MEIVTKRFLLRDFREEDAAAFQEYHADPRSLEFYGLDEVKPGHVQQLLETFKNWATEKPRRNYQFAIVQRQGSQLLAGCCGLRTADSESGKAELGIELAPEFWGRYGYAIEIMHDLVDFGLGSLKLSEIYGSTVSANARVARLARSLGAVATTRAYSSLDGCSGLEPNSLACHKRAMGEWHSNNAFNSDAPKAARALTQTLGEYFDDYRRQ